VIGTYLVTPTLEWCEPTGTLERASKVQDIRPDTLCSFAGDDVDGDILSLNVSGRRLAGPMVAIEDELSAEVVEATSTHDVVKFWPWVQQVVLPQSYEVGAMLIVGSGPTRLL